MSKKKAEGTGGRMRLDIGAANRFIQHGLASSEGISLTAWRERKRMEREQGISDPKLAGANVGKPKPGRSGKRSNANTTASGAMPPPPARKPKNRSQKSTKLRQAAESRLHTGANSPQQQQKQPQQPKRTEKRRADSVGASSSNSGPSSKSGKLANRRLPVPAARKSKVQQHHLQTPKNLAVFSSRFASLTSPPMHFGGWAPLDSPLLAYDVDLRWKFYRFQALVERRKARMQRQSRANEGLYVKEK